MGRKDHQAPRWDTDVILDPTELDSYIKTNGRWLYHATAEDSLAGIEDRGIDPDSANEQHPFWRSGRVYVSTLAVCHYHQRNGNLPLGIVRVDLTQLDPEQIGSDEDLVQKAFHAGEPWIDGRPPTYPSGEADRMLAEWAENTPGIDSQEVTAKSLLGGSISYAGPVPAAAVQVVDRRGYRQR